MQAKNHHHNKKLPTKFENIKVNTAFTPASPDPQTGMTFIKRVNGVCPQVLNEKTEHIFWPDDRVFPVQLPEKILNRYQR